MEKNRIRQTIGGVTACIGIVIMLSMSCEDFLLETAMRIFGLAMFAGGAWIGGFFDKETENVSKNKEARR